LHLALASSHRALRRTQAKQSYPEERISTLRVTLENTTVLDVTK